MQIPWEGCKRKLDLYAKSSRDNGSGGSTKHEKNDQMSARLLPHLHANAAAWGKTWGKNLRQMRVRHVKLWKLIFSLVLVARAEIMQIYSRTAHTKEVVTVFHGSQGVKGFSFCLISTQRLRFRTFKFGGWTDGVRNHGLWFKAVRYDTLYIIKSFILNWKCSYVWLYLTNLFFT